MYYYKFIKIVKQMLKVKKTLPVKISRNRRCNKTGHRLFPNVVNHPREFGTFRYQFRPCTSVKLVLDFMEQVLQLFSFLK